MSHPSWVKCARVPGASVTVGCGGAGEVYVVVYVMMGGMMHPEGPSDCVAVAVALRLRVELPTALMLTVVVGIAVRFSCESAQKVGVGVGTGGVITGGMVAAGVSVMTLVIWDVPMVITVVERMGVVVGATTRVLVLPALEDEPLPEAEELDDLLDEEDEDEDELLDDDDDALFLCLFAFFAPDEAEDEADACEAEAGMAVTLGTELELLLKELLSAGAEEELAEGAGVPRTRRDFSAYGM